MADEFHDLTVREVRSKLMNNQIMGRMSRGAGMGHTYAESWVVDSSTSMDAKEPRKDRSIRGSKDIPSAFVRLIQTEPDPKTTAPPRDQEDHKEVTPCPPEDKEDPKQADGVNHFDAYVDKPINHKKPRHAEAIEDNPKDPTSSTGSAISLFNGVLTFPYTGRSSFSVSNTSGRGGYLPSDDVDG